PATPSSTGATSTILCRADTPHLSFTLRMVDCENHWVALPKRPGEDAYGYGYVYLDPEVGFTLHVGGRFTIDAQDQYRTVSGPDTKVLLVRLRGPAAAFPPVAPLPKAALTQLGLPENPEWMKFYEDT